MSFGLLSRRGDRTSAEAIKKTRASARRLDPPLRRACALGNTATPPLRALFVYESLGGIANAIAWSKLSPPQARLNKVRLCFLDSKVRPADGAFCLCHSTLELLLPRFRRAGLLLEIR